MERVKCHFASHQKFAFSTSYWSLYLHIAYDLRCIHIVLSDSCAETQRVLNVLTVFREGSSEIVSWTDQTTIDAHRIQYYVGLCYL